MTDQAKEKSMQWEPYIAPLMFSYNTACHRATKESPFLTLFGYDPRAPLWPEGDIFSADFDQEDVRKDPLRALHFTQQRVRAAAHHNNQHYRLDYTARANKHLHRHPPRVRSGGPRVVQATHLHGNQQEAV